jgi:hypothetical protein
MTNDEGARAGMKLRWNHKLLVESPFFWLASEPMKRRTLLALLVAVASLVSCKDMRKAGGMTDAAVVDFHQKFNEGKFKEIHAAGHADFREETTEGDFLKLMEAMQRKLGRQVKSSSEGWMINSHNMKTSIRITVKSEFEQGKGTETFTYVVSGDSCTLQSYHIESMDMMLK